MALITSPMRLQKALRLQEVPARQTSSTLLQKALHLHGAPVRQTDSTLLQKALHLHGVPVRQTDSTLLQKEHRLQGALVRRVEAIQNLVAHKGLHLQGAPALAGIKLALEARHHQEALARAEVFQALQEALRVQV